MLAKFPVGAYVATNIPANVKYWERRAFSNPLSAKEFADMIINSAIAKEVVKIVFAKYAGWVILGLGMKIPPHEFTERYGQYYDELCEKVGGVYLEAIINFENFLMSDWIDEMGLVVISDTVEGLYQTKIENHRLAAFKIRLREVATYFKAGMLSEMLQRIERKYLALSPTAYRESEIFEILKLCDNVCESLIKRVHKHLRLGPPRRKTLGIIVREIENEGSLPKSLLFKMGRIVEYRNKIEHYDLADIKEYRFEKMDIEIVLSDMLDIADYVISQHIL